ncbi:TonB-dependent receptor [Nitrospirillum iridis]|uniref:Iron complex outermembrane receptor protein n=1 Tax=Nitrospirillum iridis TaxID=765888 RepID=A0A7X0AZ50_9PROT|nr:TonB-dependent receptor [Nitrospirillum iridis]MBB6251214.1 iron complex outermembrane receptor protein [Nitrospirillum iridis]
MWKNRITALMGATMLATSGVSAAAIAAEGSQSQVLDEIVVTAQRREESLQEVPISITSLSGKALEESGYQSVTDLQYMVPGLQYDPTQGAAFQIRGVGSESFDFSNEKSVSIVVDDVVMDGQRDNGMTGLDDIKRVDVLMGPQGTLFGKNATSGVIAITTNDPELGRFSGKVSASYGENNDKIDSARVNVPLGDKAALRLSTFYQGQDGHGEYKVLHQSLGSFEDYGTRAKLLVQPTDTLEILAAGDYAHHWDSTIRTAVSGAPATVTAHEIALGVTPGPENVDSADGSKGQITTDEYGGSVRVKADIGSDTLTAITALRYTTYNNDTPADLLPGNIYAYIPYNQGRLDTTKFSEEIRWASPTGQFLEYLGGVFFNVLTADQTQLQLYTAGQPLVNAAGQKLTSFYSTTSPYGSGNEARFKSRNRTAAAFGQVKLNLTDKASIAFGGRFSDDRNSQGLTFPTADVDAITGVKTTVIGTSKVPYLTHGSVSGQDFSYRISPQYKFNDDVMVYATYSTGYKPGGVAFVGSLYDPYKAETVKSYEVGVKSELFDRRLRVNFDLFQEDFTDFQASILTNVPGAVVQQVVIGNAGGLTSKGAELNVAWRATDALTLNGSVTYTDAAFTDYVYNTTTDYTGTKLTNSPRWMTTVSANYDQPIAEDMTFHGTVSYSYRSTMFTVVGEPAYSRTPGYGLVNLRAGVSLDDDALQLGVYAKNLFNTYFSTGWQMYGSLGLLHYTSLDAYRTVGVFAQYSF